MKTLVLALLLSTVATAQTLPTAYLAPLDVAVAECSTTPGCTIDATGATHGTPPLYTPVDAGLSADVVRTWTLTPTTVDPPPTDLVLLANVPGVFHAPIATGPPSADVYTLPMPSVPVTAIEASWRVTVGPMGGNTAVDALAHYNLGYFRDSSTSGWWQDAVLGYGNVDNSTGRGRYNASKGNGTMGKVVRSGRRATVVEGGTYLVTMSFSGTDSIMEVYDEAAQTTVISLRQDINLVTTSTVEGLWGHSRHDDGPERPSYGWTYSDLQVIGYVATAATNGARSKRGGVSGIPPYKGCKASMADLRSLNPAHPCYRCPSLRNALSHMWWSMRLAQAGLCGVAHNGTHPNGWDMATITRLFAKVELQPITWGRAYVPVTAWIVNALPAAVYDGEAPERFPAVAVAAGRLAGQRSRSFTGAQWVTKATEMVAREADRQWAAGGRDGAAVVWFGQYREE